MSFETGYWGIPESERGKVHIALDGRPLCGTNINKRAVFQWCAHGVYLDYVECEKCLTAYKKLINTDTMWGFSSGKGKARHFWQRNDWISKHGSKTVRFEQWQSACGLTTSRPIIRRGAYYWGRVCRHCELSAKARGES